MFLKLYTILYIALYLILQLNPEVLRHYGVWEAVDLIAMIFALIGMVSYAFRVKMLRRRFWEYYWYVFIIYELLYMSWLQMPLLDKLQVRDQAAINDIFNICMMVPLVYSLFRLQQQWDALFGKKAENQDV